MTDRVKTNNRSVLNHISTIHEAISKTLDGRKHEPEKIRFKYVVIRFINSAMNTVLDRFGKKGAVLGVDKMLVILPRSC